MTNSTKRKQQPDQEPRVRLNLSVADFLLICAALDRARVVEPPKYSGVYHKLAAIQSSERWAL